MQWKCHLVPPHVPPDGAVDLAQHVPLAVLELHLGQGPGPVPGALAVYRHLQTSTVNISEINIKVEGNIMWRIPSLQLRRTKWGPVETDSLSNRG